MSRTEWEPLGFFSEALCNATTFDIKLGFFSSSAINVLADGFAAFLYNGGRMRLIINDVLSEEDRNAIVVGESEVNTPYFDLNAIDCISYTLSKRDKHFFECLSWLIKNERIEIKIITPKVGNGIAHSKCGMFSDGISKVAFDGSCNFSRMALVENIESINAFCDWDGERDKNRINDIVNDFNRTFSGEDDTVKFVRVKGNGINFLVGVGCRLHICHINAGPVCVVVAARILPHIRLDGAPVQLVLEIERL